jgi:GrpB-like predicted nucleotidyltransferase (UPF0157 family)
MRFIPSLVYTGKRYNPLIMPVDAAAIFVTEYDPRWPGLFEQERALLAPVLAPWLAGPIEHIGSTAVPGLAAKPVIDIMAAIQTLEGSRDAIDALQSLGYLYAPYHPEAEHWFCKPHPNHRTHHLHLVPIQSPVWTACIAFRNRLRASPSIAAEYLALKRKLAASFPNDREAYTSGKTEFVTRILNECDGPSPSDPPPSCTS